MVRRVRARAKGPTSERGQGSTNVAETRLSGLGRLPPRDRAGILALQRQAGNAAVVRALTGSRDASPPTVQRQLLITDKNRVFTDPLQAEAYLRAEYAAFAQAAPDRAKEERLLELAKVALASNMVVPIALAPALAYIHSATPLNVAPHYIDPSMSPARDDSGQWEYQMAGASATPLEAPQSPRHLFPESQFPSVSIDVPTNLWNVNQSLVAESAQIPSSKLGNNTFKYRISAELRCTTFERKTGPDALEYFGPSDAPSYSSSSVDSQLYGSKFKIPTRRGVRAANLQPEMRAELHHIKEEGPKRPYFQAGSTIWAHERDSSAVDRSGDYFTNPAKSSAQSLGMMFAHSEVQAAADAHREAGVRLARSLVRAIIAKARERQDNGKPLEVVVVAVTWTGFSGPNSVCGNACKGALIHIGEIVDAEFTRARHARKADLRAENISLRGSAQLSVSGHIGSESRYASGYGVGAMPPPPARHGTPRPRNKYVTEYHPYH